MERSKERRGVAGRRFGAARIVAVGLLLLTAVATSAAAADEPRIDLNSASAAELETLPGVGPSKAQAIIAHRETAPFKSAEELIDVKGIGEKLFAQLKDRVTVGGAPGNASRPKGQGEPSAAASGEGKAGRTASAAGTR